MRGIGSVTRRLLSTDLELIRSNQTPNYPWQGTVYNSSYKACAENWRHTTEQLAKSANKQRRCTQREVRFVEDQPLDQGNAQTKDTLDEAGKREADAWTSSWGQDNWVRKNDRKRSTPWVSASKEHSSPSGFQAVASRRKLNKKPKVWKWLKRGTCGKGPSLKYQKS